MDPHTHVAAALCRLVASEPTGVAAGSESWRNLLLDDAGGDFRPLVIFLSQMASAGVPAEIAAAAERGERWEETHRRLSLAWVGEHYTQPEMARWGVQAWGAALGRCSPLAAAPDETADRRLATGHTHPTVTPVASTRAHSSAGTGRVSPGAGGARGAAVHPGATPSPLARGSGSPRGAPTPWSPSRAGPLLNRTERQALWGMAVFGIACACVILFLAPSNDPLPAVRRTMEAPTPPRATPASTAPVRPEPTAPRADTGSASAPSDSTFVAPPPAVASLDARTIARLSAADGARLLAGAYRLRVRREAVFGGAPCAEMERGIAWTQFAVDTIATDVDRATFVITSRPSLTGRMRPGGAFDSDVVRRSATASQNAFILRGQLTPWGFEATGETTTLATLRWRRTVRCRFVAALSGERVR